MRSVRLTSALLLLSATTIARSFSALFILAAASTIFVGPAYAEQLVYVPLAQPCRLLDTRASSGGAPLTSVQGPYLFGTSDADISSTMQHGSSTGCGLPAGIAAISTSMNLLNTTASGNIATWNADNGTIAPNIGTAVYNPSVASPVAGEVQYNTGYSTIPVGSAPDPLTLGRFYLQVANGQIDMTINVVGYWLSLKSAASNDGVGVYQAGAGLLLSGSTFSVAPTYRLPQGCGTNAVPQWNGSNSAWNCTSLPTGVPAGTVNQTLRYDASNTLVANNSLKAFANGGLLAEGGGGPIPTEGAGTRMMWYPAKAAFRAGRVGGTADGGQQWDDANIGDYSFATGVDTVASGNTSTAMGKATTASGMASIAMGSDTTASGLGSTAIGFGTTASGWGSTAMGESTRASGNYSTAMGKNASTTSEDGSTIYHRSFVYGDGGSLNNLNTYSTASGQFMVRATGGFVFYTSSDITHGVQLAPGAGSWTTLSDRNAKIAIVPVNARAVLDKVAAMPLATWQYKAQSAKYRHMGPMAQDFYAAFELGESDTGIDTVDADGVALAAIQGLHSLVKEQIAEIAALRAKLIERDLHAATLESRIAAQDSRIAMLESAHHDLVEIKRQLAGLQQATAAPRALEVALQQ